jgi:hypothetical protein
MKSTNNGDARSLNLNATPFADNDIYRHNPWRAPGNAPVANVCGYAGGSPFGPNGAEAGDYVNTTYAHHGMKGSDLPKMPTNTVWKIGGEATVTSNIRNNHGGGYSYRLCPASEPLTEKCFQAHPLDFVQEKQAILYPDGHTVPIKGVFISTGTFPTGSMWSRLPIPAGGLGPRCLPGPNDTDSTPNGCMKWEGRSNYDGHVNGPCVACPETVGSDCSRCNITRNVQSYCIMYTHTVILHTHTVHSYCTAGALMQHTHTVHSYCTLMLHTRNVLTPTPFHTSYFHPSIPRCSNPGSHDPKHPVSPPTPGTAFPPPLGIYGAPAQDVLDVLKVPADLPAGEYVLGYRYDCEGTAQVWSNCADITLAA